MTASRPDLGRSDPDYIVARHLAERIAAVSRLSFEDAWDGLTMVPDNLLHLLETPEGWDMVSLWAAGPDAARPILPTVH